MKSAESEDNRVEQFSLWQEDYRGRREAVR